MHTTFRNILAVTVIAAIPAIAAAQYSFTLIDGASGATGVSADGSMVAGAGTGGAYYWTADGGRVDLGGTGAVGISGDGSVITGNIDDAGISVAGIWTADGGWQSLGGTPDGSPCDASLSSAYGLNYDGSVAVGLAWEGCTAEAYKWTADTGMLALPNVGDGSARANGVSDNGQYVGGWDTISWGGRRATLWHPDGTVEHVLDGVVDDGYGEVYWVSDDGNFAVGSTYDGYGGYRWTRDGGAELFDLLPGTDPFLGGGWATAATADGSVIVGGQDNGDFWSPVWDAWVMIDGDMQRLADILTDAGVTIPANFQLASLGDVSADGRTVVGWGYWDGWVFNSQGFVATLGGSDCPEDIDGDGYVGLADLAILLANYGTTSGAGPDDGDINGDGAVDLADLAMLLAVYDTSC
jgi:uncharacterized membrane protein